LVTSYSNRNGIQVNIQFYYDYMYFYSSFEIPKENYSIEKVRIEHCRKTKRINSKKSKKSENFEQRDFIREEKCKLKSDAKLEMSTMESNTSYTHPEYASLPEGNNPVLPSASL